MRRDDKSVTVIIPAYNAASTIRRAIASALNEPQVDRVVVIDDASQDGTGEAAGGEAAGSERFHLIRNDSNRGPSYARNLGIERSESEFIAILDADDFFVSGRFAVLLGNDDFDFIADDIAFVDERVVGELDASRLPKRASGRSQLTLSSFIAGNIRGRGPHRSELGFLKPVMRRRALDRFGLRYDPNLRLGEDFIFYTRALARGARFVLDSHRGYVATVRPNSLSGQHRTADLEGQLKADLQLLAEESMDPSAARLLRQHYKSIRDKYVLRCLLDDKRQLGLVTAIANRLRAPSSVWPALAGVLADKLKDRRRPLTVESAPSPAVRYLFESSLPGRALDSTGPA